MKPLAGAAAIAAIALLSSVATAQSLTGTIRDFTAGPLDVANGVNPDFQRCISGVRTGLVASTLSGPAPTLTAAAGPTAAGGCIGNATTFNAWWDSPAAFSKQYEIPLTETAPGSGIYQFSSNSFFPINGELLNEGVAGNNYYFTYQIAATFFYDKGMDQTFSFTGDDDVWVFFDKQLGIDLGGVHSAASANINLDDFFDGIGGRETGNYSFDFFFAERHTTQSNLTIQTTLEFNQAQVPEPSSLALLGLSIFALASARRMRKLA